MVVEHIAIKQFDDKTLLRPEWVFADAETEIRWREDSEGLGGLLPSPNISTSPKVNTNRDRNEALFIFSFIHLSPAYTLGPLSLHFYVSPFVCFSGIIVPEAS